MSPITIKYSGRRALLLICLLLIIGLRVVALSSDAYPKLSWSSALLTDEGFYIHNARNLILFGREKTDGFNNALIMPTLHYLQIAVFKIFGVGVVQARMISVVLSLLTLIIFYRAILLVFGMNAAVLSTLFLGLDHINLLYNRMALMDTPAAFVMTVTFYLFCSAYQKSLLREGDLNQQTAANSVSIPKLSFWWMLCGIMLILCYATRGVAAILFPAPIIALWYCKDIPLKRSIAPLIAGILAGYLLYKLTWINSHQDEMMRMSHYYFSVQLIPHRFITLYFNIRRALMDSGGLFPYLFKHSAIQFLLTILSLMVLPTNYCRARLTKMQYALLTFCAAWVLTAWIAFFCINYAPSRYYVLFYPAMAAIAGIALSQPEVISEHLRNSRSTRASICFLFFFYLLRAADIMQIGIAQAAGFTICVLVFGIMWKKQIPVKFEKPKKLYYILLSIWFILNGCWTFDWLYHLSYRQIQADHWLEANLPANSVLFGAVAPGLCMDNHFQAVSVIAKLCNDDHPVERAQHVPRYIIILDDNRFNSRWKEQWWVKNYPSVMQQKNRIHSFTGLMRPFFTIGIYPVPNNEFTEIPVK